MDTLIACISLVLFFAFVVGLFKPALVRMPNRVLSSVTYLGASLALAVVGSKLYPTEKPQIDQQHVASDPVTQSAPKYFDSAEKTLSEYLNEPKAKRHAIVDDYLVYKSISASAAGGFYACLSEFTFTKNGELKLGDVLGWCLGDYEKDPASLSRKINLDVFQDNFSGWDGSYRPLEKMIKSSMHDDSSYKHDSTVYHVLLSKDPHAIVKTTFRGTNSYGGVVKQTVAARVDVRTGEVIEILDN
ncbi:hypothetical protein [Erwinia sp. LJJL01]|uniref:hypothetical protein n=1 Tax=Erwinia sp. LJJL01 TaxID=3391839 RepID=UPI00105C79C0